jgi:hypothetical protein
VSPPWCSRLVSPAATVPSADFFHAVRAGCPALSHFLLHAASRGAWKTSQSKHMSFSTWMPSIRAELIMDRGLYLVLQSSHSCTPDSISVRHPVLSRYPASAELLPSEAPSPIPRCNNCYTLRRLRLAGSKTYQSQHYVVTLTHF